MSGSQSMVNITHTDRVENTGTYPREKKRLTVENAVVDFYNQINLLYGSITEFCSPQSCPEMKATDECDAAPYPF